MAYKLKIGPSQSLKLKGNAGFALPIIGGSAIAAAKSGGMWTIDLDYSEVQTGSTVDDTTAYILTWDSASGLFTRLTVTDLKVEFEDTFDGYYQPLDATLTALAALDSTAGLLVQTGADTFERRTLTGTANEITVTNGAGTAGNPTLSLPSALTFTGKTVTGGTYASVVSVNKITITAPATGATLTIADGKTLTVSNDATVSGTNTGDQTITLTGDVTGTGTGSFAATIAANAVTNAKMATMAAYTLKGNATGSSAVPTDVDIAALTTKASPAGSDYALISDQAASGALKKVLLSSLASAGSVSSIAGNTGAFTLSGLLTNSVNDLRVTAAVQSDMETGTSTSVVVTPGRQHNHPGHPKAWLRCNASGTIGASYNVSSVTDGAAGIATPNWTTAFSSTAYAMNATTQGPSGGNRLATASDSPAVGSNAVYSFASTTGALSDPTYWSVSAFGDQ